MLLSMGSTFSGVPCSRGGATSAHLVSLGGKSLSSAMMRLCRVLPNYDRAFLGWDLYRRMSPSSRRGLQP